VHQRGDILALIRLPSRRDFIQSLSAGLGSVGLLGMLTQQDARGAASLVGAQNRIAHFPAKAKHNIVLFMPGGPSQMDLFDPKPDLLRYAGQRPDSVNLRTERVTGGLLPSPFSFAQYGESGQVLSELLPNLATMADDLCIVPSM